MTKIKYVTPVVEEVPFHIDRPICSASTSMSGGNYGIEDDNFDDDSD